MALSMGKGAVVGLDTIGTGSTRPIEVIIKPVRHPQILEIHQRIQCNQIDLTVELLRMEHPEETL